MGSGSCRRDEAAIGVDKARKESSSRAVTLPAEVHSGFGRRCSGILEKNFEYS